MLFKVSKSELGHGNLGQIVRQTVQEISALHYNGNLVDYELRDGGSNSRTGAVRFMLRVKDSHKEPMRRAASGRRTNAANWEAHKRVMLALFATFPNAKLVSALATYDGLADFQAKHQDTWKHNAGSMFAPADFGSL